MLDQMVIVSCTACAWTGRRKAGWEGRTGRVIEKAGRQFHTHRCPACGDCVETTRRVEHWPPWKFARKTKHFKRKKK